MPARGGDRSNLLFSIGGGWNERNHFTLDGSNNTDVNFNCCIFLPSIDALQEFTVQTGVYSAQLVRELGQVNLLASGIKARFGSPFEFLRHNIFEARRYAFPGSAPPSRTFKWGLYGAASAVWLMSPE